MQFIYSNADQQHFDILLHIRLQVKKKITFNTLNCIIHQPLLLCCSCMKARPVSGMNKLLPQQLDITRKQKMLFIVGQNPLRRNVSIPDADFSRHPARLTNSAEKQHHGIIGYCSLWLKDCNQITTWNRSTPYEEMCCSLGFLIQGTPSISYVHELFVFHKSQVTGNRSNTNKSLDHTISI